MTSEKKIRINLEIETEYNNALLNNGSLLNKKILEILKKNKLCYTVTAGYLKPSKNPRIVDAEFN